MVSWQTWRHGGTYRGVPPQTTACAPQRKIVLPKRGLWPEENNRLGATGVQIEAQIGVCHSYFRAFCGWHRISWHFWDEDLFLGGITCFRPEKPLVFAILAGKSLWIFGLHLVYLINFSCPRAPLEFTQINVSCPPKIYFSPPSHAILAPGLPHGRGSVAAVSE